jgi:hypothetical protein
LRLEAVRRRGRGLGCEIADEGGDAGKSHGASKDGGMWLHGEAAGWVITAPAQLRGQL